ncbi:MAG: polysaccharide export protein [Proteobacteria bacterium]|nr:polysaccharide export protein [Pseudomonadota bacterium]
MLFVKRKRTVSIIFFMLVFQVCFLTLLQTSAFPAAGNADSSEQTDSAVKQSDKTLKKSSFVTSREDDKDYVVGPEDTIKITVWDHEDLTKEFFVSRDGWFSFPLIGKVYADGLSVGDLEKKIVEALSGKYIVNPQVSIFVTQVKSKVVYVMGEVGGKLFGAGKGPGSYPLTGRTSLLEILSVAGGPTADAASEIIIVRPKVKRNMPVPIEDARKDEITTINMKKLLEGDLSQNILLEPNDTVYVPKAEFFFASGEVMKPGKFVLEKGLTVLKAIATAGGKTNKAAINRTRIIRVKGGERKEFRVTLDEMVLPEDIIVVPESFF